MANPRNTTRSVSTERFLTRWIEDTRQELRVQREELRKEARIAFIVFVIAFAIGLLLIFTGVISAFIGNLPTSIVTATPGVTIGVFCSVAFTFYKEVNNRLFRVSTEMNLLDKNNIAMQYISRIADCKAKDRAIQDLSKSIYARA